VGVLVFGLHAHDDVAIHLDEAAVAIPGEALVAGLALGEGFDGLSLRPRLRMVSIMPGMESRAPERTETRSGRRIFGVAELFAHDFLDLATRFHLRVEALGVGALVVVEIGADLGGDGEARRHGQADAAHLGEVCALAAQQRLHLFC
jgi:hypothetical protein